jgi:hypothetical protein
LEELDHHRSEYLTQLAHTRELESKMDDIQQQIDRTKLILHNSDSGDLLLLTYMAARLYLLRELTSRDYDDFFTARAQYSSWCQEQQQLYLHLVQESLQSQDKLSTISKLIQNLCFEQTKDFLLSLTEQKMNPPTPLSLSSSANSNTQSSEMTIQFKITPKLSFEQLAEGGEKIIKQYFTSGPSSSTVPPLALSTQSSFPSLPSSSRHSSQSYEERSPQLERTEEGGGTTPTLSAKSTPRPSSIITSPRLGSAVSSPRPGSTMSSPRLSSSPPSRHIPDMSLPLLSLSEFERDLTVSLSEYEQNVCNTMERLSEMSLEAIRKKFIDIHATEGLLTAPSRELLLLSLTPL